MADIAIAIDGPASSGKGTVARGVAQRLGYQYVDTGAMYRAVAWVARGQGVSWDDEAALARVAEALDCRFPWEGGQLRVLVAGADVTRQIRADDIGTGASRVSRWPAVRAALLDRQRAMARAGGVVMDGRDIGTVVLPGAELKVYLDAQLEERARRRHEELFRRGEECTYSSVLEAMAARDRQDMERAVAPLQAAEDAVIVDTTRLSIGDAIARVLELAAERGVTR